MSDPTSGFHPHRCEGCDRAFDIEALSRDYLCAECIDRSLAEERQFLADCDAWEIGQGRSS